jgi:hypothetical protein
MWKFLLILLIAGCQSPSTNPKLVEKDGFIEVEAEDFSDQQKDEVRKWYRVDLNQNPEVLPDPDGNHAETASGQAYIEVLPDTRVTHDDSLAVGINFSNESGAMAVLNYKIEFTTTGRYYVWVRAFSTGSEDNGIHVGIDNRWPESGKRMQWCEGKEQWTWASKQRTDSNHCGELYLIYLDIDTKGEHMVQFSMREDGFEFDKFILTTDKDFIPEELRVDSGFGEKATPQSLGIDETKMLEALEYLKSKSFRDGIGEVVIVRNKKIIYEGDSVSKKHSIYSCSKVFTSTVLGLLVAEGKVKLNDFVAKYEPDLADFYPIVTFRHFATMTSGYSAKGRSRWNDENADWSLTPYTPEKPHFAPGTHFEYWDEAQMMYGKVLTNILGKTMKEYLTEKITDPIGMGELRWDTEQQTSGIPINNGCTGVNVDARQLARFGQLYLNKGKWNGKQLLSEEWCAMATTNQVPASIPVFSGDRSSAEGSGSYGFNWWVNSADGLSRMPDSPPTVAYMSGKNHNVCCLIPEWNMIIVRMGDDQNPPEGKHVVWNEFLKRIEKSIENK